MSKQSTRSGPYTVTKSGQSTRSGPISSGRTTNRGSGGKGGKKTKKG